MNSEEMMRKMEENIVDIERQLVDFQHKIAAFELMQAELMETNISEHEEKILALEHKMIEHFEKTSGYEQMKAEEMQKMIEHYEKMSGDEQMKAEEMQRKMDEYEARISDYELKRVRYERKILRLEDALFYKKYEILNAKFTVVEALPELNLALGTSPFEELMRTPGNLDPFIFDKACREAWAREGKVEYEMQISSEADNLYRFWKGLIENGQWELYHAQGPYGLIESADIEDLRDKYGASLYDAIKIAWLEFHELRRTGVTLKPWNRGAGREQTLRELLEQLPITINNLRNGY